MNKEIKKEQEWMSAITRIDNHKEGLRLLLRHIKKGVLMSEKEKKLFIETIETIIETFEEEEIREIDVIRLLTKSYSALLNNYFSPAGRL